MDPVTIIMLIGGIALGLIAGVLARRYIFESRLESLDKISKKIVEDAHKEAKTIKKEADLQSKDLLYQMKQEFEQETRQTRESLLEQERSLLQKEATLEKQVELSLAKENNLERRQHQIQEEERAVAEKASKYDELLSNCQVELERVAGMTATQAKESLLKALEEEAKHEAAKTIRRIEMEANETADHKAKEILALAVKRYAGDYVAEKTVSVVHLPSEEMKGRIIGREGRNIRALEAATGVDLIVDDTPEAVILSGFNPIRREVARQALVTLINDGRIHPARIEEVVNKVEADIEVEIKEEGQAAAFDVGVHGIHPELIKLIGKLKYRTSYAQNVLQHSIEVAFLCGIMASELRLNVKQAKRAGLLHDIGKAVDHEIEGPHALIGADLCRKYGETEKIIQAVAAHHEDIPADSVLTALVQASDTLSGARPGARREMLESYVKRLQDLENIATSFPGVEKSYAIQAGREVRIIVESNKINDDQASMISRDVAKKVEEEMMYPGQIKITVIRETRAVSYAK